MLLEVRDELNLSLHLAEPFERVFLLLTQDVQRVLLGSQALLCGIVLDLGVVELLTHHFGLDVEHLELFAALLDVLEVRSCGDDASLVVGAVLRGLTDTAQANCSRVRVTVHCLETGFESSITGHFVPFLFQLLKVVLVLVIGHLDEVLQAEVRRH